MTGTERTFGETVTLVSITDLNGDIQYCNREFIDISGYTENELIGAHHNIVRHPDMPKSAFEDLWSTIKSDKPWRGMVKNRCKNGDYYWVEAYVTPVIENGEKVGYQSIRSCPSRKQIEKAEQQYKHLSAHPDKKLPQPPVWNRLTLSSKVNTLVGLIFLTFLLMQWSDGQLLSTDIIHVLCNVGIIVLFIALLYLINVDVVNRIRRLSAMVTTLSTGDLTENIRVLKEDEIGEAVMSVKMLQGRLKAVIGRFGESSHSLLHTTDKLSQTSATTKESMNAQHVETELVATAMNEMSSTVSEIAQNTTRTAELASLADESANHGKTVVAATQETILALSESLTQISQSINELDSECQQIRDITDAINGISEQTNLLALNAAIEAARAGEHGRGFAVVADEVRVLSTRTQQSTIEITATIDKLQRGSQQAVSAVDSGLEKVRFSVEQIERTGIAFNDIADSVAQVNDMNMQIATAAEEQSSVAEEMNQNVTSISTHSYKTVEGVEQLESNVRALLAMSASLERQLEQYKLS